MSDSWSITLCSFTAHVITFAYGGQNKWNRKSQHSYVERIRKLCVAWMDRLSEWFGENSHGKKSCAQKCYYMYFDTLSHNVCVIPFFSVFLPIGFSSQNGLQKTQQWRYHKKNEKKTHKTSKNRPGAKAINSIWLNLFFFCQRKHITLPWFWFIFSDGNSVHTLHKIYKRFSGQSETVLMSIVDRRLEWDD